MLATTNVSPLKLDAFKYYYAPFTQFGPYGTAAKKLKEWDLKP